MKIVIIKKENDLEESLVDFRDLFFSRQMKYLASDLLNEGLSPAEISHAVKKAMKSCRTAELEIRQHFIPVYTQVDEMLVSDCKLSRLGYGLVLMNAEVNIPIAAHWQIKVMSDFLK